MERYTGRLACAGRRGEHKPIVVGQMI